MHSARGLSCATRESSERAVTGRPSRHPFERMAKPSCAGIAVSHGEEPARREAKLLVWLSLYHAQLAANYYTVGVKVKKW